MGVSVPVGMTQAVMRWTVAGDPEEMVTTFGVDDSPVFDPRDTAEAIYDAAVATGSISPVAAMNQGWTFVGVTCYYQDDPGITVGIHNEPITATVGGLLTLPNNCSFLVHKLTASTGRQNRGRFYVPPYGLGEGDVGITGTIESSAYTTLQNRWTAFYNNLVAAALTPELFHEAAIAATPITSFSLDTRIATQRRRMRN